MPETTAALERLAAVKPFVDASQYLPKTNVPVQTTCSITR